MFPKLNLSVTLLTLETTFKTHWIHQPKHIHTHFVPRILTRGIILSIIRFYSFNLNPKLSSNVCQYPLDVQPTVLLSEQTCAGICCGLRVPLLHPTLLNQPTFPLSAVHLSIKKLPSVCSKVEPFPVNKATKKTSSLRGKNPHIFTPFHSHLDS